MDTVTVIFLVKFNEISVSDGNTSEYFGISNTSSKVKDSFIVSILIYKQFLKIIKSLKFYNVYKFPLIHSC